MDYRVGPDNDGKEVWRMVAFDSNGAKSLHAPLPVNSPLSTFTSGQSNSCGVRRVPYLNSLRRSIVLTDGFNETNEIMVFRLRV